MLMVVIIFDLISVSFAVLLATFISYPLTIFNQDVLNRIFRRPFVKIVNIFNNLFGTKIQSAMLLTVGKNFIPYVDYGYRKGVKIGVHTNPLVVSDYLIKYIEEDNEIGVKNTSKWLLNNYEDNGEYIFWKAYYERPIFRLKSGWPSGYYQSRALKALCMMYDRGIDGKYLKIILRGLKAFEININDGGFKADGKAGHWYEEYPLKNHAPPFVLNGFVESLLDLHFIYEKTGIKKAKELFDKGLAELKSKIKEFDTGKWTYYDLLGHPARFDYHKIHIREMNDMYKITKDRMFFDIAEKWKKYKKADWRFFILNVCLLNAVVLLFLVLL